MNKIYSKDLARECAEKIVRLTGYGQALHVNDILPDILQALTQRDQALINAIEGMRKVVRHRTDRHWKDVTEVSDNAFNRGLDAILSLIQEENKGEECDHHWIDATNTHLGGAVTGGEYCRDCGLLRRHKGENICCEKCVSFPMLPNYGNGFQSHSGGCTNPNCPHCHNK